MHLQKRGNKKEEEEEKERRVLCVGSFAALAGLLTVLGTDALHLGIGLRGGMEMV